MTGPITKNVAVTLYRVTQELHAQPGEYVMILGGVCIGTYSGDPDSSLPIALEYKPALEVPRGSAKKRKDYARYSSPDDIKDYTIQMMAKVVEILSVEKRVTRRDILDSFGTDIAGERGWRFKNAAMALLVADIVIRHGDRIGTYYTRGPAFIELTAETADQVAAQLDEAYDRGRTSPETEDSDND